MRSTYEQEFITLKRIGEGNFTFVDMVLSRTTNLPTPSSAAKQADAEALGAVPSLVSRHVVARLLHEIRMFEEVRACPNLLQYYKSWQEDGADLLG